MTPSNLAELFIKNLERLLDARRPAWLAKEAKLPQSTVGRILKGEMKPSFDTIAPLADALGVHPIEFFIEKDANIKRPVKLADDQIEALKVAWREMIEVEYKEHPEAMIIVERVPKDIQMALADYDRDWNLLRAVLDIPEKKNKKGKSDAG